MLAIDDGRNNFYATDNEGNRINIDDVPDNLRHVIIESSPFDKDPDKQNGQFQINNQIDSGGPYPSGGNVFLFFTVTDLGSSWIELKVEQYGYYSFYEGGMSFIRSGSLKSSTRPKTTIPILQLLKGLLITAELIKEAY
ncbi:hypothetical protein KZP23_21605 [Echinicola marina]|uniref:hypothetical protein n=1 Tax=Echinicola marina TaxID=2859768 RepID=UPI001CF6B175|nr:hypothetical protein [Echinicola marina]UCS93213.1 hypothetical protein KZP23_21605 [Echinicola marina]